MTKQEYYAAKSQLMTTVKFVADHLPEKDLPMFYDALAERLAHVEQLTYRDWSDRMITEMP